MPHTSMSAIVGVGVGLREGLGRPRERTCVGVGVGLREGLRVYRASVIESA